MQLDFFEQSTNLLPLKGAYVYHYPKFLSPDEADKLYEYLYKEIPWEKYRITVYGKEYNQPRLTAWYGEGGASYSYSGLAMKVYSFTEILRELKVKIEAYSGHRFNSVLANLYRSGTDSVGWHADDEASLGKDPVIASLSLGTTRTFRLRSKKKPYEYHNIDLSSGSLLIMASGSQVNYMHCLPKSLKVSTPRINLTFRQIIS